MTSARHFFDPLRPSAFLTPLQRSQRIVKGLALPAFHDNDKGGAAQTSYHRVVAGALRRRKLGLLDEQALLQRTAVLEKGIGNYFCEEFTSRASFAAAGRAAHRMSFSEQEHFSRASLSSGFQCVARKDPIKDFSSKAVVGVANNNNNTDGGGSDSVEYDITLRHIPAHQVPNAEFAAGSIAQRGFLNYFAPNEHMGAHVRHGLLPGLMLLQGRYAAAFETQCRAPRLLLRSNTVMTLGGSETGATPDVRAYALQVVRAPENEISRSSDLAQALRKHQPVELSDELCRGVLQAVVGFEGLSGLVQEFAAIVWNECLTRRVRQHGALSVLPGDLCVVPSPGDAATKNARLMFLPASDADESARCIATSGLRAHDVVLPTLGYATRFCAGASHTEHLTQALVRHGVAVSEDRRAAALEERFSSSSSRSGLDALLSINDIFDRRALSFHDEHAGLWNVPGEYRRAVEHPRDLRWALEPDIELSEQELGFSLARLKKLSSSSSSSSKTKLRRIEAKKKLDAQLRRECLHKLRLQFVLPAGVSPWMLLRELCKRERFVIDEGMRKALARRAETAKHTEGVDASTRYRIYKRIKREYRWAGSRIPDGFHTARLWNRIFHHGGLRRSLIPTPRSQPDAL